MLPSGTQGYEEFRGIALDVHRSSLPGGLFQEDVGGNPSDLARWKRRRGQRHTDVFVKDNPLSTLLGFEMNSEQYGLLVIDGPNACGFVNVMEQLWIPSGGYGDTEFGAYDYGD